MFRKILTTNIKDRSCMSKEYGSIYSYIYSYLKALFIVSFCIMTFSSCSDNDDPDPKKLPQRTLIVYLAADNNLYWEMDQRLDSIASGFTKNIDGRVIVYCDKGGSNPVLLELKHDNTGKVYKEEIAVYEEQNSATKEVLQNAIQQAMQQAPAESYGLLVWSHGWGWLPTGAYNNPYKTSTKSIFIDGSTEMPISDFAAAIPDGVFDYIIMEACFMGAVEVAYELRNKTKNILFSSGEIFVPGFIPVYPSTLKYLFEKEANLVQFTKEWFTYVTTEASTKWATISVINTTELENLATVIKEVGVPTRSSELSGVQSFKGYSNNYHFFYDFGDVYERLLSEEKWNETKDLLNDIILYSANTTSFAGYTIHRHTGFTTHINGTFPVLDEYHKTLEWHKAVTAE